MNVSVIIPAYNAEETITDTLESLLAQTYPNWEAIVVDDGSSDRTGEIARSFAERDARIRVLRQVQGGEAAARNAGIALARYDWLLFLDSDDWISPVHLERLTHELLSQPDLDAVHCGSARVFPDGTQIVEQYLPPSGDIFSTLARRAAFPVHACIVRRSLVQAVGTFDTSLQKSTDWDFWQRVARTGARFGAVREVLAFYRMRPSSASLEARQLLIDGLRVLERGHGPDPRVKNPHPDHTDGLPHDLISTQEFYLLSWCAGLSLGRGEDARPLIEYVTGDHYPDLNPDFVAQCVFDAAPLATSQSTDGWQRLWPQIEHDVKDFLVALEEQSRAPDLAFRAYNCLKKMILKHSPAWKPIIEEYEQAIATQRASIEELAQARALSEKERAEWQRLADEREKERNEWQRLADEREAILEKQRVSIEELVQARVLSEKERAEWQRLAEDRESVIVSLEEKFWVRLGFHLRILKQPAMVSPSFDMTYRASSVAEAPYPDNPAGSIEKVDVTKWRLRVTEGNVAGLVFPPDRPEVVRIGIKKANTKKSFDIQLNRIGLKAKSGHRYTVNFRAKADRSRSMVVGFAKAYDPWTNLGLYRKIDLGAEWKAFEEVFVAGADDDNTRIHFDVGGSNIAVEVASVALRSPSEDESVRASKENHNVG